MRKNFSSDGSSLFYKKSVQPYSGLMRIRLKNITLDDTVSLIYSRMEEFFGIGRGGGMREEQIGMKANYAENE